MTSMVGEAIVEVRGDVTKLKSDVSGAGKSAGAGFASGFRANLKGVAESLGLLYAGEKGLEFLKGSVEAAREANKVAAVTAARIKSTGGAAHITAKQALEYGDALAQQTGIMPDVISGGENMLLTFKNIRNEQGKGNDIFKQSTQVMLDLAASMAGGGRGSAGLNPKAAAIQLGKALNDPIKGLTSLSRVGVQFSASQTTQIQKMVANNNLLGAQKIILKELNSEFGGTAKAQSNAAGRMAAAWQVLKEGVGNLLIPVLDKLEGTLTKNVIPHLTTFVHQMESGQGAGGKFAHDLDQVFNAAKSVAGVLGGIIHALDGMPDWAKKALATGLIGGYAAKKLGVGSLLAPAAKGVAGALAGDVKPVPVIIVKDLTGSLGGGTGGSLGKTAAADAEKAAGGGLLVAGGQAALVLGVATIISGGITYLINKALNSTGKDPSKQFGNQGQQILASGGNGAGAESGSGMGLPGGTNLNDLGNLFGQGGAGKGLAVLPPDFVKNLTAGAVQLHMYETTLKGLGLLTPAIRKQLDGLAKTKVEAQIGADSKPLEGRYRQSKAMLLELGHAKPVSTLDANAKPAQSKVGAILHSLGIVNNYKATAQVDANTTNALQSLARVHQALDQIPSTKVITIRQQGGAQIGHNASGSMSWRGGPTIVGEQGRELVDLPAGSRIHANPATERMLSGGRVGLVITNWRTGTGYMVDLADERIAVQSAYDDRMGGNG